MSVEQGVAKHYSRGALEERILAALREAGKDPDKLGAADLASVDEFHVGGLEATEALAGFMGLRPGMHLLDVGCGIGGPARYFAEQGCEVTGVDLTEEFVRMAGSLTRLVKLEQRARFQQGSVLALPFERGTFDGAYMFHVGMNISDKAGAFREVARVLKRGARFTVFDIISSKDGSFAFPVPWALSEETSFVRSVTDYRRGLEQAGFRIDHERSRLQFAIEFTQKVMQRAATASSPALGLHLLMGEKTPVMIKNILAGMQSGVLEPVELIAVAS